MTSKPDPDSVIPSLGGSGAIAGVLGAYLPLFPSNRIRVLLPLGCFLIRILIKWHCSRKFSSVAPLKQIFIHRRTHSIACSSNCARFTILMIEISMRRTSKFCYPIAHSRFDVTSRNTSPPTIREAASNPDHIVPRMPCPLIVLAPQRYSPLTSVEFPGRLNRNCEGMRAMP